MRDLLNQLSNWKYLLLGVVFIVWLSVRLVFSISGNGTFAIHFLDVGQGDAILIKSPDGGYGLIDAGKGDFVLDELRQTLPRGEKLDFVMVTHPDADHFEGLLSVLDHYEVEMLFWQKHNKQTPMTEALEEKVFSLDIPNYQLSADSDFWLGCCVFFDIIWPDKDLGNNFYNLDANEISYTVVVQFEGKNIWLGGDLGSENEDLLAKNLDSELLPIFIHKLGHHGSNSSSSEFLLQFLKPKYAIVSAGAGNSYGHPHQAVLDRVEEIGAEILRTDEQGRISFLFKNGIWSTETQF